MLGRGLLGSARTSTHQTPDDEGLHLLGRKAATTPKELERLRGRGAIELSSSLVVVGE